jgi:iron(III) transport system permease protein
MAAPALTLPRAAAASARPVRQAWGRDDRIMRGGLALLGLWLALTLVLPIWALLAKSFRAADGSFVGFANFQTYFANPALAASIGNSVWIASLSTAICVLLAFGYAYGITRTRMPARGLFRAIAQIPILAPSLLPAISLLYLTCSATRTSPRDSCSATRSTGRSASSSARCSGPSRTR